MSEEPLQIAIVDDFSPDRQIIRRILRKGLKQKYIDHEGALGADALRLCATLAPTPPSSTTILLLDLGLPDMNGLDVLKKLKGNLAMLPLPVVILTGSLRDADIELVLAAGAQDFIAKSELTYENINRLIINAIERFRLTQKLYVSEERSRQQLTDLQAIYTAAPVGLAVLDSELRYVRLNKYLAEISGLPVEAHIGRTVREIASPFTDQFEMQIRQVLETGNPLVDLEMSGTIITQPSIRRTWLGSCYPLHGKEKALIGVNCVLYEVTERVQAELAEREQRQLAEALRDGLAALTSSLNVQEVMQQILTAAAAVVPSEAGSIILFEGDQGRAAHLRGFPPEAEAFFETYRFPIKSMAHVDTLMKKQPYFVADTQAQSDWLALPFTEWIRSSIGIPIELHDELIGLLIVDSAIPHHFNAADIDKLCVFARYASLALEKAAYIGKLEERVAARTAELQTAKERVEAILNHSFDGIVLVQPNLHIEHANAAFNHLFGLTADTTFVGSLSDLICQDDMTQVYTLLQSIHSTQVGQHIEIRCYRQNGSVFAAELSIGPIHGDGLVCTLRDITTRKRLSTALQESEEKFRLLLQAAPVAIITADQAGQITLVNHQAERLFGYTSTELLGQSIELLTPEAKRHPHTTNHGTDMARADIWPIVPGQESFAQRKDGTVFPIETALGYVETTSGLLAMNFIMDITLRKQAEVALRESEQKYRNLVETIQGGLLIFSIDGWTTYVNDRLCRWLGYTPEEILGRSATEFVDAESKPVLQAQSQKGRQGESSIEELTLQCKDGRPLHTIAAVSPLRNDQREIIGTLAVLIDIETQKQAETALRENLQKEKELGELKSRFVSMASHEFRTPLASILAITETLRAYRHRLQDEQIDQRLGKIQEQIGYLKAIMNDVLELARLQARRAEFNPVLLDLDDLCRSVLDEFQNRPEVAERLIYHCDKHLQAILLDKKLMRQIINNLVSNALKYSPAEKPVTINVTQTPGLLTLTVQDEGIGIPEADLVHLFEPFHRATNVGAISGTGLGMVITKESVELHGGTIRIESQLDVGTRITVQIPGV